MSDRLRIVLADDHAPTRAGIRAALQADGFDVCAEAGDSAAAVDAVLKHRPDLCVLDVDMPGGGVAAAGDIAARAPEVTVVMFTESESPAEFIDAIRAGARGFLHKEMDPDRLGVALRGAVEGEAAIPRRLVNLLVDRVAVGSDAKHRDPRFALTEREWEVLDLLAAAATTKEIARCLGVSDVTVRRHISHLVQKLGATGRDDAVRMTRVGPPRERD